MSGEEITFFNPDRPVENGTTNVLPPSTAVVLAGLVEEMTQLAGTLTARYQFTAAGNVQAMRDRLHAALGRHGAAEVAARYHPAMRLEHGEGGLVTATCACGVSTTLANNRAAINWWKYHDAVLAAVPSSPDHGTAPEGDPDVQS